MSDGVRGRNSRKTRGCKCKFGEMEHVPLCSPRTPLSLHCRIDCSSRGEATTYGTFIDDSNSCASATFLPASIDPAGPPTRGKPIVLTMASTSTRRSLIFFAILPPPPPPPSFSFFPSDSRSAVDVSQSRTIAWASTPLINMGTGIMPDSSIIAMRSRTYLCWVTTCFRYSSTATLGGGGTPDGDELRAMGKPRSSAISSKAGDSRHLMYSDADSMYFGRASYGK